MHDVFPANFGTVGVSSLRVYLYTVLAEIRFLAALFFIYFLARGRSWRFLLWLPIIITTYQAVIRIFALQRTVYNEFDVKLWLTVLVFALLTVLYYVKKHGE